MFRRLAIISTLVLAIAIPILAQGRRAQAQAQGRGIQRIQEALDLTPGQQTQLQGLLDTRRQETQGLAQESREKAQTLRNLMQQPNPNPAEVGNAVLALKASRQKLQSIQEQFQTNFKSILRSDQVTKYEELLKAGNGRRRLGRALRGLR